MTPATAPKSAAITHKETYGEAILPVLWMLSSIAMQNVVTTIAVSHCDGFLRWKIKVDSEAKNTIPIAASATIEMASGWSQSLSSR